ncbi:hypothetical protein ACPF8X_32585 [Streptomyces sp. G35A]
MKLTARLGTFLGAATLLTGVLSGTAEAAPASKSDITPMGGCTFGMLCGVVYNKLPSNYTVKIADFAGGSSTCSTWNAGSYKCTHWWLPSGKSSKDIRGTWSDTDGFMVESTYWVNDHGDGGDDPKKVGAFVWTKISNHELARCEERSGYGVFCEIDVL